MTLSTLALPYNYCIVAEENCSSVALKKISLKSLKKRSTNFKGRFSFSKTQQKRLDISDYQYLIRFKHFNFLNKGF